MTSQYKYFCVFFLSDSLLGIFQDSQFISSALPTLYDYWCYKSVILKLSCNIIWATGLTGVASRADSSNRRCPLYGFTAQSGGILRAHLPSTRLWGGEEVSPQQELREVEAKVRDKPSTGNGDFAVIWSSLDCGPSQWKAPCGSWSLGVFCWLSKCVKLEEGLFASDTPWGNRKCS